MSQPEEQNPSEPKPLYLEGTQFVILADQVEDFGTEDAPLPGHYAALVFRCHHCNLEVSAYGKDRREAFLKAARELRHLVVSHQSRCDVCDANIMFKLLGYDGLTPGQKGDPE